MEPYQKEYLALLSSVSSYTGPSAGQMEPEAFVEAAKEASRLSRKAVEEGSQLLRRELFPVLDNILASSPEEVASLLEFAGELMSGVKQKDVGLFYRIHLALVDLARHRKDRDLLIRELYFVGMALFNLETMLSPNLFRLYTARMRMCFMESASYFDTQYDEISDPETRGYIHRSLGNIALSYEGSDPQSAKKKLDAVTRSIQILSDPEVRAKTPSLPWDLYLYKSHQERTTLLSFLRSGNADPDTFAQVLESAQIVQERQFKAARERHEPVQPRWQYAYIAALYHCGAMLLPELLEGIYALSTSRTDEDFGVQSMFSHVSVPALCLEYAKQLDPNDRYRKELAVHVDRMSRHLWRWIVKAPSDSNNEQLMFYLRQYLYVYQEELCPLPFFEALQNVFAARQPTAYARMWITGHIAAQLTAWAIEDRPEELVGLPGCREAGDAAGQREALLEYAMKAGRLYDAGMVHFFNSESTACRGIFEEEEALFQLHAYCGAELLSQHPSTAQFADIARGHHRHYNDRGGYPADFSLGDSPVRAMICLVAAADLLASSAEETSSRYQPAISFEAGCARLREEAGRQYAPFVAALLKSPECREALRDKIEAWKKEAYLDLYRRREEMSASV